MFKVGDYVIRSSDHQDSFIARKAYKIVGVYYYGDNIHRIDLEGKAETCHYNPRYFTLAKTKQSEIPWL